MIRKGIVISALLLGACALSPEELPDTLVPVPSTEDRAAAAGWRGGGTWMDQHEEINRIDREAELVFLGDSITQSWGGPGRNVRAAAKEVWERFFGRYRAANFGISGDRTQHLLWRMDHGNFRGLHPRAVVLLIGTNNLAHDPPEDIARGIEAIVHRLLDCDANTRVLLTSIVRGGTRDDPLRRKSAEVNALVRPLEKGERVRYVELTERFYLPNGEANPELMGADFVHFTPAGYCAWAEALEPFLKEIL